MPAPHHSSFYGPDSLPATQPTASKHWRHQSNDNCEKVVMIIVHNSTVLVLVAQWPNDLGALWPRGRRFDPRPGRCGLFFEVADPTLMGKLSSDVTTTYVDSAFHPFGIGKMNISFGWVVQVGMVFVVGYTVWSMPERFRGWATSRYTNPRTLLFSYLLFIHGQNAM